MSSLLCVNAKEEDEVSETRLGRNKAFFQIIPGLWKMFCCPLFCVWKDGGKSSEQTNFCKALNSSRFLSQRNILSPSLSPSPFLSLPHSLWSPPLLWIHFLPPTFCFFFSEFYQFVFIFQLPILSVSFFSSPAARKLFSASVELRSWITRRIRRNTVVIPILEKLDSLVTQPKLQLSQKTVRN